MKLKFLIITLMFSLTISQDRSTLFATGDGDPNPELGGYSIENIGNGILGAADRFYLSNESWDILFLLLALCGSIIGFLRYNIYPAKILMGDGGSYLLGSNLGIASLLGLTNKEQYFGLINNQNLNILSINLALIIMLIPIADMTFVILNRIKNSRSPFYPDKTHFHHKLLKVGFHPRKSVMIFYGLQMSLSCIAILISGLKAKVFYICLALIFISLSFLYIFNMKDYLDNNKDI